MPTFKHPCPHCGKWIERDVRACPYCSIADPFAPGRCPSCRAIIEDLAWAACPKCGASLKVEATAEAAEAGVAAAPTPPPATPPTAEAPAPPAAPPALPAATALAQTCTGCGAPLPSGARFCSSCGTLVPG